MEFWKKGRSHQFFFGLFIPLSALYKCKGRVTAHHIVREKYKKNIALHFPFPAVCRQTVKRHKILSDTQVWKGYCLQSSAELAPLSSPPSPALHLPAVLKLCTCEASGFLHVVSSAGNVPGLAGKSKPRHRVYYDGLPTPRDAGWEHVSAPPASHTNLQLSQFP